TCHRIEIEKWTGRNRLQRRIALEILQKPKEILLGSNENEMRRQIHPAFIAKRVELRADLLRQRNINVVQRLFRMQFPLEHLSVFDGKDMPLLAVMRLRQELLPTLEQVFQERTDPDRELGSRNLVGGALKKQLAAIPIQDDHEPRGVLNPHFFPEKIH